MRTLGTFRHALGEGPCWSVAAQRLYWVDIFACRVHSCTLDGADHRQWAVPNHVGFAVPAEDGTIIAGVRDGLVVLDPETGGTRTLHALESDRPEQRFNDGKTDQQGRLWFGSMHNDGSQPVGALYRYDGDSAPVVIETGIGTSNGLGWSPAGDLLYYTDSATHEIASYDFDAVTGAVGNRRVFATDPVSILPDGLAVDSEGFIWSAKWNGGTVVRYRPDGNVDRVIEMPISRPTSCAFAGPNLTTLVITSAVDGDPATTAPDPAELPGAIFLIEVSVPGLPETPSRVPTAPASN